jgi:hypothetical protein
MRVLTNRKLRRAVLALRTGPLSSKQGADILRNFCLIRFRRLFTYPVPGVLPLKHRRHRTNFVRSSLYYFFSYTNKFGQFRTCMHNDRSAQHRTSHISIELRNHIREIALFHTCTYIYILQEVSVFLDVVKIYLSAVTSGLDCRHNATSVLDCAACRSVSSNPSPV